MTLLIDTELVERALAGTYTQEDLTALAPQVVTTMVVDPEGVTQDGQAVATMRDSLESADFAAWLSQEPGLAGVWGVVLKTMADARALAAGDPFVKALEGAAAVGYPQWAGEGGDLEQVRAAFLARVGDVESSLEPDRLEQVLASTRELLGLFEALAPALSELGDPDEFIEQVRFSRAHLAHNLPRALADLEQVLVWGREHVEDMPRRGGRHVA